MGIVHFLNLIICNDFKYLCGPARQIRKLALYPTELRGHVSSRLIKPNAISAQRHVKTSYIIATFHRISSIITHQVGIKWGSFSSYLTNHNNDLNWVEASSLSIFSTFKSQIQINSTRNYTTLTASEGRDGQEIHGYEPEQQGLVQKTAS